MRVLWFFFVDRVFFEAPKCPNLDIFGGDTAGFATQFAPEIRQTNDAQWLRRCTTKMIDDVWQNQRKVASISKINSVNSLHTYKHTSQFFATHANLSWDFCTSLILTPASCKPHCHWILTTSAILWAALESGDWNSRPWEQESQGVLKFSTPCHVSSFLLGAIV